MADLADRLLGAYTQLTRLAGPIGRAVVAVRRMRGKEHPTRWPERLGRPSARRSDGPTIWIHAASVGETIAVLPLINRIVASGLAVVLTTVTTTSAELVVGRLPPGAVHQFVPLDIAPFVDRFLEAWQPQLAVFVESEIWPVAIARLAARRIPLVISNARMSDRSFRRWMRVPAAASAVFSRIGLCLAQSDAEADRFTALGVARAVGVGNIKFDASAPEAPRSLAAALGNAIGQRPVFLAASTHPGEDELVLDVFEQLMLRVPGLLMVIAPRHPERGADVMSLAVGRQLDVCQRAAGALPSRSTSVYVADTVGELGTFYRLAHVTLVGGSLVAHGGHNPIEPARLGAAVVTGPHVGNFTAIYDALLTAGGAEMAPDPDALVDLVARLIADPDGRARQSAAAATVVAQYSGAIERTWSVLDSMVTPLVLAARVARHDTAG